MFRPASAATRATRRTLFNLGAALIGAVLLVVTVRQVGWSEVQRSLAALGWWFVPIVALGGLRFAARARAWHVCAGAPALSLRRVLAATLSADALGNLTPLGLLASEPAKVWLVNTRVSTVTAISSVAAENAFYIASVLAMIGAGALVFFGLADLPPVLRVGAQVVLALVMTAAVAAIWVARRQPALLSHAARTMTRWTGRGAAAPERLVELERHFYAVLRWPLPRVAHVLLWEAAFHAAAVAEVYLVIRLLPLGQGATLLDAFVLETAGRLIIVAFKFIPYRLGVDEAGTAIVARALTLDPALGVTLALVRRLRILVWNGVGLALLATPAYTRAR